MDPRTALAIVSLLDHLALAIRLGPKAHRDYESLSARVRNMVANERPPTDTEWTDLGRKLDSSSARLRAAAALLNE